MRYFLNMAIILILILSVNLYSQIKSVDDFFKGKEKKWEREILPDFNIAVAKESNDFVIAQWDESIGKGIVDYYSSDGELKWSANDSDIPEISKIWAIYLQISNNGEAVLVVWNGDLESARVQIYDRTGEMTFQVPFDVCGLMGIHLSPGGGYVCASRIWSKYGKEKRIPKMVKYEFNSKSYKFINDQKLVVNIWENPPIERSYGDWTKKPRRSCWYVYNIEENRVISKITHNRSAWGAGYEILSFDNKFLIKGSSFKFYDENGIIIWKQPNNIFDIAEENTIIDKKNGRIYSLKDRFVYIVDLYNGDLISKEELIANKCIQNISYPIVFKKYENRVWFTGIMSHYNPCCESNTSYPNCIFNYVLEINGNKKTILTDFEKLTIIPGILQFTPKGSNLEMLFFSSN